MSVHVEGDELLDANKVQEMEEGQETPTLTMNEQLPQGQGSGNTSTTGSTPQGSRASTVLPCPRPSQAGASGNNPQGASNSRPLLSH